MGAEKHFIAPEVRGIALVGVGGTGSYLAQGLAKMVSGYRLNMQVALIDPDGVEEKNRFRQNFMPWEVGQSKAHSLAFRLNQQFGLDFSPFVGTGQEFFRRHHFRSFNLLITCVDKIAPRKDLRQHPLWLDCGNDLDFGQVILGTTSSQKDCAREIRQWGKTPNVAALPNAFLKGELAKRRDSKKATASCADNPFAEQGCFINEVAAQSAQMILHQLLILGTVTTPAIWFNTARCRLAPARITPDYLTL